MGCGGSSDGVGGEGKVGTRDARDGGGEIEKKEKEEGVFMNADMVRRQDVKEEVVDSAKMMKGGVRVEGDDVEGKMERSTGHVRWEMWYKDGDVSGREEEQREFRMEVKSYYKQMSVEFGAPSSTKRSSICLNRLYITDIKLGGCEQNLHYCLLDIQKFLREGTT